VPCLYESDYGAPDPGFDPFADGGRLVAGFAAQDRQLARAKNLGQLQAMERTLARGDEILWCEQGYGWVYGRSVDALFAAIVIAVILPYAVWKARAWPIRLLKRGTASHRSYALPRE
jgi:hypothetical protein